MSERTELSINEDAYLSEEEEKELILLASKTVKMKKMNTIERENYLEKLPELRMFADANRDILGDEGYLKLEEENIEIINNREWENE